VVEDPVISGLAYDICTHALSMLENDLNIGPSEICGDLG
jgi:hypothetical protein